MPGPGSRNNFNPQGTMSPEQEQAIKDAMMKQAMQKQALSNQQGMTQTNATTPLSLQEDPWNLKGTRENVPMSNLEKANIFDSQGLLGTPEGMMLPRNAENNLLDRYNSYQLNNYNGPEFETTDDMYSYLNGLNLNTDRRTFKGGRGGGPIADDIGNKNLKTNANSFVNQQNFNITGQQPVYQDGDDVYVLETGYGTNIPSLGVDADGKAIPWSGHGGFYDVAEKGKIGGYTKYTPQDKQGPDTDLWSDVVAPAVVKAGLTYVAPWSGPIMTQLEQGGFDLGEWDWGDLAKDMATTYATSEYLQRIPGLEESAGMFDLSQYAPTGWENIAGDFGRGIVDSGLKQLISDGEIDWSTLGIDGLVSVGQALIGDTFGDANQTSDNNMDLSTGNATPVYGGPEGMDWKDIRATVSNTTDWRGLLGPEGVISQITGLDIPFIPTDWVGDGFDWLEDNGLGAVGDMLLTGMGQNPIVSGEKGRVDERYFDVFSPRGDEHGLWGGVYLNNPLDPNGEAGFGGWGIPGQWSGPASPTNTGSGVGTTSPMDNLSFTNTESAMYDYSEGASGTMLPTANVGSIMDLFDDAELIGDVNYDELFGDNEITLSDGTTLAGGFLQNAIDAMDGTLTKERVDEIDDLTVNPAGPPPEEGTPEPDEPVPETPSESWWNGNVKDKVEGADNLSLAGNNYNGRDGTDNAGGLLPDGGGEGGLLPDGGGEGGLLPDGGGTVLPDGGGTVLPDADGIVLPEGYDPEVPPELPPPPQPGELPKAPKQQKAEQDNYMIDKELWRLARITQVISLTEGDLASIQKRMAVLREQKEAIAGDIVGAVQKKSGKYIKQTYEEEGRRKRTREDNIVENPELYTT